MEYSNSTSLDIDNKQWRPKPILFQTQVQVMIDPYSHSSPELMYSPRNVPGAGCDRYEGFMSI